MEDGLAGRVVQIGIRTMNSHQRRQAERFGVEVHGARGVPSIAGLGLEPPLYLSLDLDVLDPSCAPGVAHPEPGGLTTREVISIIQDLPCPLVGADIVELNPHRDLNGLTAMVAAKLLKEILANMIGLPCNTDQPHRGGNHDRIRHAWNQRPGARRRVLRRASRRSSAPVASWRRRRSSPGRSHPRRPRSR